MLESLRALRANPLRTWLSMLGMIIGVAAVVLMLSIGEGARLRVEQTIASQGSNALIIIPGAPNMSGMRMAAGTAPTLTFADADALAKLELLDAVAPGLYSGAQLQFGAQNWSSSVWGTTPEFADARGWQLAAGQMLNTADVRTAAQKVVLGATVATNLFGEIAPDASNVIGQTVRIKGNPYTVIGLFHRKGQSMEGRDQDDIAVVPITTAQRKLFGNPFPGTVRIIVARSRDEKSTPQAMKQINDLLRQRHRLNEGQENDFTVRDLTAQAEAAAEATRIMSMLLGAIASISLLVGGIGIMNIMLVAVTERTREIGVRMAIGARQRDILTQFLIEAVVVCMSGGILGALIGIGLAAALAQFAGMTVVVSMLTVSIAFGFAAAIGVFFGYYPARKAAQLQPVEALRTA